MTRPIVGKQWRVPTLPLLESYHTAQHDNAFEIPPKCPATIRQLVAQHLILEGPAIRQHRGYHKLETELTRTKEQKRTKNEYEHAEKLINTLVYSTKKENKGEVAKKTALTVSVSVRTPGPIPLPRSTRGDE